MCKFCDAVLEEKRMMLWQRSTMATDNLYDTIYELNNYESVYDYSNFELTPYRSDDTYYLSIGYFQLLKAENIEINVAPFSESINLNFCPCCGKQLSKNINNTKYDNYIEIIE